MMLWYTLTIIVYIGITIPLWWLNFLDQFFILFKLISWNKNLDCWKLTIFLLTILVYNYWIFFLYINILWLYDLNTLWTNGFLLISFSFVGVHFFNWRSFLFLFLNIAFVLFSFNFFLFAHYFCFDGLDMLFIFS